MDFGRPIALSVGALPDGASVYRGRNGTVLKVSPREFPNVAREMAEKVVIARDALGEELGRVTPILLSQWEVDGVTSALFEELTPIFENRVRRFIQLRRLVPRILSWLRKVTELDRGLSGQLDACLKALAGCPYSLLSQNATDALAAVSSSHFAARAAVMHSDLWLGNIMLDPVGSREFVLIDWRGSNVDGFPIFDLVRFAQSAKLRPKALRRELAAHAERLGCSILQTRIYLLAALGYIWLHLEQFPPERFNAMAESCLRTIDDALNA
jgi:thiamine kinase-like enzyme